MVNENKSMLEILADLDANDELEGKLSPYDLKIAELEAWAGTKQVTSEIYHQALKSLHLAAYCATTLVGDNVNKKGNAAISTCCTTYYGTISRYANETPQTRCERLFEKLTPVVGDRHNTLVIMSQCLMNMPKLGSDGDYRRVMVAWAPVIAKNTVDDFDRE